MSLYIIEGPRSSGKSTVVAGIQNAFCASRVNVFKFRRSDQPAADMTEFLAKFWLALVDSRTICVIDRFHLSEYVMRYLDGKVEIKELMTTTTMIDILLQHIGAITYVLDTKEHVRLARTRNREDPRHRKMEWGNMKELDRAWKNATNLFSRSRIKVMPCNDQIEADKIVIDIMHEQTKQTRLLVKKQNTPPFEVAVQGATE